MKIGVFATFMSPLATPTILKPLAPLRLERARVEVKLPAGPKTT